MSEQVLLLHGFNKSSCDMQPLARNLESYGYECQSLNLPLTRREFDFSTALVENALYDIASKKDTKIHLVGHSTGGLLLRNVLKETEAIQSIGRCVQIATPNRGSQLAHMASKIMGYTQYFRTLKSLHSTYIEKLKLPDTTPFPIGGIAGTRNNVWLGKLLPGENDGLVELASVHYPGLSDFVTLHYGHLEIHHKPEVADLTAHFLQTGRFHD
ncbi:alpha/beta hydrolase [Sporosarcina sp. PTS2304]|uniref:PGAP1-like alpha/beta domain-containing protein n=1 Tax=Sporosarcina sp. PTS2304 TaxID=2283194 RepID=UPI000E0D344F|nr:alpha/beta hydrolase [Sporosarcina sp. PTS2304]AXI00012.1 alpha/beta hydrolase [Sporosarcina sp. PTS2304]